MSTRPGGNPTTNPAANPIAATSTTATSTPSTDVGLTFVEMMFAVAVGDTASQVAKVMQQLHVSRDPALGAAMSVGDALWQVSPSLAHLSLALLVIATSWVGWYHSLSTRKYMASLHDIFSPSVPWLISFPFLMLLIDVFLVVCYFILSEGAELPTYDAKTPQFILKPSAGSEVFWIMAIMCTYLIWNVCIALHTCCIEGGRFFENQRGWRMAAALVSLGVACYAFSTKSDVTAIEAVLKIDVALLLAVFTFRLRWVNAKSQFLLWDAIRGAVLVAVAVYLIRIA